MKWYLSEDEVQFFRAEPNPLTISNAAINQTVKGAVAEYLEKKIALERDKRRRQQKTGALRRFETFFIHKEYIKDITLTDLEFYVAHLLKTKRPSTVNNEISMMRMFFDRCVEWKYLLTSPCKDLKNIKVFEGEKPIWQESQLNHAIRATKQMEWAGEWFRNALRLLRRTCMRPKELEWLKDTDVIFNDPSDPNYVLGYRGYLKVFCRKNANGFRYIPFDYRVKRILLSQLRTCTHQGDWLFKTRLGTRVQAHAIYFNKGRLEKITGVKFPKPYAIRHTGATIMCRKNVNLKKVQIYLGHSNIATTLQYTLVGINDLQDCLKSV